MEQLWILAGIILVIVYIFDRKVLQFDLTAIKGFLKILLIGSGISIVLNLLVGRIPQLPPLPVSSLLFVWWEDVLFSLLLIYYAEKFLPKAMFIAVAIASSIVFGLGHLYQGWLAVVLLSLYPYFFSYKYGKKHGYGTVMLAHVVYDLSLVGNSYILQFIRSLI